MKFYFKMNTARNLKNWYQFLLNLTKAAETYFIVIYDFQTTQNKQTIFMFSKSIYVFNNNGIIIYFHMILH